MREDDFWTKLGETAETKGELDVKSWIYICKRGRKTYIEDGPAAVDQAERSAIAHPLRATPASAMRLECLASVGLAKIKDKESAPSTASASACF